MSDKELSLQEALKQSNISTKKTSITQKKKVKPKSTFSDDEDALDEEVESGHYSDDLDDDGDFVRTDNSGKVKLLPPSVLKDIEQKNLARKLAGLAPIVVRIRRCLACGSSFQSSGNRTCGCASRSAGTIAGREII